MSKNISSLFRFIVIIAKYPRAGVSFALRLIANIPGFRRELIYPENRFLLKKKREEEKLSIGHAIGYRVANLYLYNRKIFSIKISEGEDATADQFFLNRSIKDVELLISISHNILSIKKGDLIFDPGCGTGRHLFHFVDKYNCLAVGVDIYKQAITIAEKANWDSSAKFYNKSSLDTELIDEILPAGCDIVFINSWLNHVVNYSGYKKFIDCILMKTKYIMVITSSKVPIEYYFEGCHFLMTKIINQTQYCIILGKKGQN